MNDCVGMSFVANYFKHLFLSQAYESGLVNGQHVWILPGWLPDGWWLKGDCIDTGANSILKYIFTVDAYPGNSSDDEPSVMWKVSIVSYI